MNDGACHSIPCFPSVMDAEDHFRSSLESTESRVWLFGLTCGYYVRNDRVRRELRQKAQRQDVRIRLLDPRSPHWRMRYDLEPPSARYHDLDRFRAEVVRPYLELGRTLGHVDGSLDVSIYRFWPVFGFELLDDTLRVRLYGYQKRGTASPILVPESGSSIYAYFIEQVNRIEESAAMEKIDALADWVA